METAPSMKEIEQAGSSARSYPTAEDLRALARKHVAEADDKYVQHGKAEIAVKVLDNPTAPMEALAAARDFLVKYLS